MSGNGLMKDLNAGKMKGKSELRRKCMSMIDEMLEKQQCEDLKRRAEDW